MLCSTSRQGCCVATYEEAHRIVLGGILAMPSMVCMVDDVIKALPQ